MDLAPDELPISVQQTIEHLQGQLMRKTDQVRTLEARLAETTAEVEDLRERLKAAEADNETLEAMVWSEKDE